MINWRWRLVGLAAVMVLVACSGQDDAPATLPDVSPSPVTEEPEPTPTPAPTSTADLPVEPANAHEYSAEGVEAFTLHAIDVINYAYQTNDVTYLQKIMAPDCEFCANAVSRLTAIAEAGGRIEGGQLIPDRHLSISGPTEGVQTSAGLDVVITASMTIDGDGKVTNTEVDRDRYYIFNLVREGETWKLDELYRSEDQPS